MKGVYKELRPDDIAMLVEAIDFMEMNEQCNKETLIKYKELKDYLLKDPRKHK